MVRAASVFAVVAGSVAAQEIAPLSADGGLSVRQVRATDAGAWSVDDGKPYLRVSRWRYDGRGMLARVGSKAKHFSPDGQTENLTLG